jgi:Na+-driven multidrug efflux pump
MTGHQKTLLSISAIISLTLLAAAFTLIPVMGVNGAAIALLVSESLRGILMRYVVFSKLGLRNMIVYGK